MKARITLGTRGSALALRQVELVSNALAGAWPGLEIAVEKIVTSGDRKVDLSLARATPGGAKGMFTREIEEVLQAGRIDVAVHSLKDLPGQTTPGLAIVAVLPRAMPADMLISREGWGLAEMPEEAVVGTSSVRREMQLRRLRPDLHIRELRGNVPGRLRKLREDAGLNAIVLAAAGLERLGYLAEPGKLEGLRAVSLSKQLLPAVGQGIVALQGRADDAETVQCLRALNHAPTWICMCAERELLRLLDGDCNLPVGARTRLEDAELWLEALVFDPATGEARKAAGAGPAAEPERLAQAIYEDLYE